MNVALELKQNAYQNLKKIVRTRDSELFELLEKSTVDLFPVVIKHIQTIGVTEYSIRLLYFNSVYRVELFNLIYGRRNV